MVMDGAASSDSEKDVFQPKKFCKAVPSTGSVETVTTKSKAKSFLCLSCEKSFSRSNSLYYHRKTCKGKKPPKTPAINFVCEKCDSQIKLKRDFFHHYKNCKGPSDSRTTKCFYPSCERRFYLRLSMIKHLNSEHMQNYEVEELSFDSKVAFDNFKKEENMKNIMSTVKHWGVDRRSDSCSYEYYVCNFDVQHQNRYVSKIPGCKCPARMMVKVSDGKNYEVKYIKDHNHHILPKNLQYHRYAPHTLDFVYTLLVKGVSPRAIRDEIIPANVASLFPIKEHFLSLKEIRQMHYRILRRSCLHQTDAEAVRILATQLHQEGSVLIYKPQDSRETMFGESLDHLPDSSAIFAFGYQNERMLKELKAGVSKIVCIDATHNTNRYRFHLLNIIVPDEYGRGYPVAHFISNSLDAETLTVFFSTLKQRCPELTVNALMTDDDKALWLAFSRVFGIEVRHLLCSWHVRRSWERQLYNYVRNNKELRDEIFAHLITLMEEKNPADFPGMLELFVNKYKDNTATAAFIEYFEKNYSNRPEKWASCFRNFPHACTDTNMFCESYHSCLKRCHLKDRVNTRVEDLIHIVTVIENDKFLELRKDRCFEKVPRFVAKNKNWQASHDAGIQISDSQVSLISENKWNVKSVSREDVEHTVIRQIASCPLPNECFLKCEQPACLNLCSHLFSCTCESYFSNPLCKHIHKVQSFGLKSILPKLEDKESPIEPLEWKLHSTPPAGLPNFEMLRSEKMIEKINNKLNVLRESLHEESVQKALLPFINNTLDKIMSAVNSVTTNAVTLPSLPTMEYVKIPPNQKKTKQKELYQTLKKKKKPSKPASALSFPCRELQFSLKKELLGLEPSLQAAGFASFIAQTYEDLHKPLFTVTGIRVNMLHLKALYGAVDDAELRKLIFITKRRPTDSPFQQGWLFDSTIDIFLNLLLSQHPDSMNLSCCESAGFLRWPDDIYQKNKARLQFVGKHCIFIPTNPTGTHWVLLVCNVRRNTIFFLDPLVPAVNPSNSSFSGPNKALLLRWKFICEDVLPGTQWKIEGAQHTRQNDGTSCGVFVCWFVECILKGQSIQEDFDPSAYRKKMLNMISIEGLKDPH